MEFLLIFWFNWASYKDYVEHFYSNRGVWIKVDDWLGIKVVINLTVVVHLIFKDLKLQFKLDFLNNVKYMFLK